jgi:ribosome-associated protein
MSPTKKKPSSKKPAPKRRPAAKHPTAPRKSKPKKKALPREPAAAPQENARAHALAKRMAALVLDKKASDVVILDVRGLTSYADYFVVASGDSERQVAAMADAVQDKLREDGVRPIGTEGQETGHWVLLDYGEVVAHLFHAEQRSFYDLEGLWADAAREPVA